MAEQQLLQGSDLYMNKVQALCRLGPRYRQDGLCHYAQDPHLRRRDARRDRIPEP